MLGNCVHEPCVDRYFDRCLAMLVFSRFCLIMAMLFRLVSGGQTNYGDDESDKCLCHVINYMRCYFWENHVPMIPEMYMYNATDRPLPIVGAGISQDSVYLMVAHWLFVIKINNILKLTSESTTMLADDDQTCSLGQRAQDAFSVSAIADALVIYGYSAMQVNNQLYHILTLWDESQQDTPFRYFPVSGFDTDLSSNQVYAQDYSLSLVLDATGKGYQVYHGYDQANEKFALLFKACIIDPTKSPVMSIDLSSGWLPLQSSDGGTVTWGTATSAQDYSPSSSDMTFNGKVSGFIGSSGTIYLFDYGLVYVVSKNGDTMSLQQQDWHTFLKCPNDVFVFLLSDPSWLNTSE